MHFPKVMILLIVPFILCYSQSNTVVINEVMFDVVGGDYHDEFVELVNADTISIDLSNFQIGDQDEQDFLINPDEQGSLLLNPGEIILILDGSYPGNSASYDSILATQIKYAYIDDASFGRSGFSNSIAEKVLLLNGDGNTIDEYVYTLNNEPGYSDERISPYGPNIPANWGNCSFLGGTPGETNSLAGGNLSVSIQSFDLKQKNEILELSIRMLNLSLDKIFPGILIFADLDFDSGFSEGDLLFSDTSIVFKAFEENGFSLSRQIEGFGTIDVMAQIKNDSSTVFEKKSIYWQNSSGLPVKLNEVNFAPISDEPEWLEMLNVSAQTINLSGGYFLFNEDTLLITDEYAIVTPHSYVIFSDKMNFPARYDLDDEKVNFVHGWKNLKTGDEKIVFLDANKNFVDSLNYTDIWWEGSHENRSLEKKSPELTNRIGMWGLCRDDMKATPGRKNSWESGSAGYGGKHMKFNSLFFNPESPVVADFLEITIDEQNSGLLKILIFDLRGRLIKKVAENEHIYGKQIYIWDGKNENDMKMPTGTYVIWSSFNESQNNWEEKKPVALYWGR